MKIHSVRQITLASIASLALAAAAWAQSPVPVTNAGFEDPVLDDAQLVTSVPPGWASFGTATFQTLNPTTSDYPAEAPEGENIAIVSFAAAEAGLVQTLTDIAGQLNAGAAYSLSVKVGNPATVAGFPGYKVQLLADGTVLAEDDNTQPPAAGTFVTSSVNYSYNAGLHAALVGQPLEVRLVTKALESSEVNFDDVRLTVSLTEPVADPGGPYFVGPGEFLQLDASGSLPSGSATITAYGWDLTDNDNFGDVTGPTPAPISYLDLKNVWNMGNGPNTIHLRVTDSSAATSTATTTVTLQALVSQLGILDLKANGGINPATGEAWAAADSYHLAYITTDTTVATSTDIASYNAFVQADAAAQTGAFANMGNADWFAMGSTATTNARDNAVIIGPLINIFNQGTVAINSTDFYNFNFTESANPTTLEGEPRNLHTGTIGGGTTHGGNELGATNGTVRIAWSAWTNWAQAWRAESTSGLKPMLGISGRLFVIDSDDNVAPNFVSITDNVAGGPITFPDDSVVYTVTFNEAMLPSTVSAADFGSAGSAGFTINSVVQQQDPAVFLVTVSPTGLGTLQLRINQDAVLTDLNGNPLDTSSAIPDETIINVVGGTPYGIWTDGFTGLANTSPTVDFDNGGLVTGLEWVLGGDPTDPTDDAAIAPTFDNTGDPDFFVFTHRRTQAANADANTAIAVEYGSNLAGWTTAVAGPNIEISVNANGAGAGIDLVEVKIRRTLAVDNKLFARLSVEVNIP